MRNMPGKLAPLSGHVSHLQRSPVFGGAWGAAAAGLSLPWGLAEAQCTRALTEGRQTGLWGEALQHPTACTRQRRQLQRDQAHVGWQCQEACGSPHSRQAACTPTRRSTVYHLIANSHIFKYWRQRHVCNSTSTWKNSLSHAHVYACTHTHTHARQAKERPNL